MDSQETLAVFIGDLEDTWQKAAEMSSEINICRLPRQFSSVLSQPASLYDEMWTAAKAMYKLESIVKDGGELIIYAPHIKEISVTHGKLIQEVGYHCRDYFLKQWEKFSDYPLGVLAHSTHLKGAGSFEEGVETTRIYVILATAIPRKICEKVNLGYMDPFSIKIEDWQNQEEKGFLYVPNAGEILYQYHPSC
jgi:nickel-dependent lactate racemase